jgi:hypothetical protein
MKYIWKEIESEEEFIKAFGKNPGWVLSPVRLGKPKQKDEETSNPDEKDPGEA